MNDSFRRTFFCLATGFVLSSRLVQADAPADATAFALVKEGNRHVGEEAKDRVVQIRSEKSLGSLVPNIWYIVYFDPDATAKATEVKFGAGKKLSVKRPARVLEFATGNTEIPKDKLKIDSDKAISIAKKEPLLNNLTLTATELKLDRWSAEPVWKVRFWATKLRKPTETVDIGEVLVHATTGEVVKTDLRINRVD
ncbi:MAG: hypothetical protein ABIP71_01595 [Verrucomicrobiota bacterium]